MTTMRRTSLWTSFALHVIRWWALVIHVRLGEIALRDSSGARVAWAWLPEARGSAGPRNPQESPAHLQQ
jgi:hypothetical protein